MAEEKKQYTCPHCGDIYWEVEGDHFQKYPQACDEHAETELKTHEIFCPQLEEEEFHCRNCGELVLTLEPGADTGTNAIVDLIEQSFYEHYRDECSYN